MFRSIFNENTDQFLYAKKFRFVFNENINKFLFKKKFQICI